MTIKFSCSHCSQTELTPPDMIGLEKMNQLKELGWFHHPISEKLYCSNHCYHRSLFLKSQIETSKRNNLQK